MAMPERAVSSAKSPTIARSAIPTRGIVIFEIMFGIERVRILAYIGLHI